MTRNRGRDGMAVFTKGAPEVLEKLCLKESVPADFRENLARFTERGYRVFAVATKKLEIDTGTGEVGFERFLMDSWMEQK